jgi:hypothetical protein
VKILRYPKYHPGSSHSEATGWSSEPVEKNPNESKSGHLSPMDCTTTDSSKHQSSNSLVSAPRSPGPQNSKETASGSPRESVSESSNRRNPCYSHRQIPLTLARASTIHKCQSLTLPQVCVSVQDFFCRWNRYRAPGVKRVEGITLRRQRRSLKREPKYVGRILATAT